LNFQKKRKTAAQANARMDGPTSRSDLLEKTKRQRKGEKEGEKKLGWTKEGTRRPRDANQREISRVFVVHEGKGKSMRGGKRGS